MPPSYWQLVGSLAVIIVATLALSASAIKSDPDFVEHLQRDETTVVAAAIRCYVCSPCNSSKDAADIWDSPILAECLPGEQFCFREFHEDGSKFLSCSDECESGTFTKNNQSYRLECCSGEDGCNRLDDMEQFETETPTMTSSTTSSPGSEEVTTTTSTTTESTTSSTTSTTTTTTEPVTSTTTTTTTQSTVTTPTTTMTTTTQSTTTSPDSTTTTAKTTLRPTLSTTQPSTAQHPTSTAVVLNYSLPVANDDHSQHRQHVAPNEKRRRCFSCSMCNVTHRADLVLCHPSEQFCYRRELDDGNTVQGCTDKCTNFLPKKFPNSRRVVVNECCSEHDGCNGIIGDALDTERSSSTYCTKSATVMLVFLTISALHSFFLF